MTRLFYTICLFFLLLTLTQGLQAQEEPEIVITSGHIANVYAIDFSPNNRFVVTAGMDKTVRIWDRSLRQEFRVLYGHTASVWKVQYTSDSKYIFSLDERGQFIVWEHATGKLVKRHRFENFTRKFTYIPNTTRVLILVNGKMVEKDVLTGEVVAEHGELLDDDIRLSSKENYLVTRAPIKINSIALYNYKTKTIEAELAADHEMAHTLFTVSADGQLAAAFALPNSTITIWDLKKKTIRTSIVLPDQYALELLFTPDNQELLVLGRMGNIDVYNSKTGRLKRTMNASTPMDAATMQSGVYRIGTAFDMAISPDNKMVGIALMLNESKKLGTTPTTFMGGLLYDYKRNKELGRLKGYFKMSTHLSVGSNGKYLINSNFNKQAGIRVWNMKEGDLDRFIPTTGTAAASSNGAVFGALEVDKKVGMKLVVYDAKSMKQVFERQDIQAVNEIAFSADGSLMLTQEVAVNLQNPMNSSYFFRVWDVAKQEQIGERIPFTQQEMPMFKTVRLSPDGKYILAQINSSEWTSWSLETQQRVASIPCQIGYEFILDFVPNSQRVLLSRTKPEYNYEKKKLDADMTWLEWDYTTGAVETTFNTGREGILFSGDFSADGKYLVTGQGGYFNEINFDVVVWDWETKQAVCTLKGHHGAVKFVWFGNKGKRIYSTADDGFIKVWDRANCSTLSSMIAFDEMDYIILSPDNYYKSSKGNNEGIGFRYNNNLYTFDQFDIRFNRPDKVLTSLGVSKYAVKLYTKAWEKRLNKMGFTPESLNGELALPNIRLLNKTSLPVTTENKKLRLNIQAEDPTYSLDRVAIAINNVPVPSLQGVSLKKEVLQQVEKELEIELSEGDNLVQVSVYNEQGLESLRESVQINYTPNQKTAPNLYLLTIGVSKFENEERNLKFARKDAEDLIAHFKGSKHYGQVHQYTLFDEAATKENVEKAAAFLRKARTDDQVLVYISSHGLLDDQLDYYIAMHDVDFAQPQERGLPYDRINSMLDGLNCRNRLIMLDACHSGEVDKEALVERNSIAAADPSIKVRSKSGSTLIRPKAGLKNSFTYMKTLFGDVAKGTGATVISAAGGYEFALESDDWNNGVFTYAILQGLSSGDADLNGDGLVRVSELKNYVTLQVVELTDGKQHPTTRTENSVNDFIVAKIKLKTNR